MPRLTQVKKAVLRAENKKQPVRLARLTFTEEEIEDWKQRGLPIPDEAWRCQAYLVQVYKFDGGERITVSTTSVKSAKHKGGGTDWEDKIPWDHLQAIKRQIGRGDRLAIEIYPHDWAVVNVANMRHLWIYDDLQALGFGLRTEEVTVGEATEGHETHRSEESCGGPVPGVSDPQL